MTLKHKGIAATVAAATTVAVGLVAPSASAAVKPEVVSPDINRVSCALAGNPLIVWQYNYSGEDCFENAGSQDVRIYDVDGVETGNNAVRLEMADGTWCNDPYKNTAASEYCSQSFPTSSTMTFISIYPGKNL